MIALTIKATQDMQTIKDEFSKAFPYLKLEFFKHFHKNMGGNSKRDLFEGNLSLKEVPKKFQREFIHITEDMPVGDLEKLFREHFGLAVQVFRKSGKIWLETIRTDDWTLRQQNEEGKALSSFIKGS